MRNRLISVECDRNTLDVMTLTNSDVSLRRFWVSKKIKHIVTGDTIFFLKEQWDEYKRVREGTPGGDT